MRRLLGAALAAVVVLSLAEPAVSLPVGGRSGAPAQAGREENGREDRADEDPSRLRLASQTAWVAPGQELVLRLVVTTARPRNDVEVAVAVHRRVTGRIEFARTLEGRARGAAVSITAVPLSELAVDPGGAVVVRLPVHGAVGPPEPGRLRLRDEGVYPVRVELREADGGDLLDELVTHLVYAALPGEGGHRLGTALVLPVHAPRATRPDGSRRLSAQAVAGLGTLAQALEGHPGVPMTVAPTPETLEALGTSPRPADHEIVTTLANAVRAHQVVTSPYVPIDLRSFLEAGLEGELGAQLARGSEAIERTLRVRADRRTWVTDEHVDGATTLGLRQRQFDRILLPERAMEPVDNPVTLAEPFEIDAGTVRRPVAMAADAGLARHFTDRGDPVLAAHRLLAELAVIYFDRPGHVRAVVAQAPRSWVPTAPFMDILLEGLRSSPVLYGTTLDQAFTSVPAATAPGGRPLVRRLAAPPDDPPELPAQALASARRRLESFGSMLDADNTLDDSIEPLLLVAEGADLRSRERTGYLRGLERRIGAEMARIRVPPDRSITLTARTGVIPVTISNEADYRVRLRVQVASAKLAFPQGSTRGIELSRRNITERFAVQARTSGAFPLDVSLVSPDGGLVVGSSQFTVRSRPSGVGVVLSAGAGGFLVVWWARHWARTRRNRRLVPS